MFTQENATQLQMSLRNFSSALNKQQTQHLVFPWGTFWRTYTLFHWDDHSERGIRREGSEREEESRSVARRSALHAICIVRSSTICFRRLILTRGESTCNPEGRRGSDIEARRESIRGALRTHLLFHLCVNHDHIISHQSSLINHRTHIVPQLHMHFPTIHHRLTFSAPLLLYPQRQSARHSAPCARPAECSARLCSARRKVLSNWVGTRRTSVWRAG